MSDRIRQVLAYLIAIGMIAAVAAVPTVAQQADPNAERVFEVAGLNADTVDGKHAVSYTNKRGARKNRLVATNRRGELPPNIVRPRWNLIQRVPDGFKDGVDDVGVAKIKLTKVVTEPVTVAPGGGENLVAWCPSGTVAAGGGYEMVGNVEDGVVYESMPRSGLSGWGAGLKVLPTAGGSIDFYVYAICMSTQPGGALVTASRAG